MEYQRFSTDEIVHTDYIWTFDPHRQTLSKTSLAFRWETQELESGHRLFRIEFLLNELEAFIKRGLIKKSENVFFVRYQHKLAFDTDFFGLVHHRFDSAERRDDVFFSMIKKHWRIVFGQVRNRGRL